MIKILQVKLFFYRKRISLLITVFSLDFESLLFEKIKFTSGIKHVKSDFININSVNIDEKIQNEFNNSSILDEYILWDIHN